MKFPQYQNVELFSIIFFLFKKKSTQCKKKIRKLQYLKKIPLFLALKKLHKVTITIFFITRTLLTIKKIYMYNFFQSQFTTRKPLRTAAIFFEQLLASSLETHLTETFFSINKISAKFCIKTYVDVLIWLNKHRESIRKPVSRKLPAWFFQRFFVRRGNGSGSGVKFKLNLRN